MKRIRGIVVGDIHFGHNKNPTVEIAFRLKKMLYKEKDIDLIVITGDLYDRILTLSSTDSIESVKFLIWLATFCNKNNIILRILEGTPSHDFKQTRMIKTVIEETGLKINFKYIEKIEIEYIKDLNLNVLYIPDEMVDESRVFIKDHNLTNIDYVMMHGNFQYQLPIEIEGSYKCKEFEFVKGNIFINHFHTHSTNGKIVAPGSFDRLAFGQEEKKGMVLFTKHPVMGYSWSFLENKDALGFKTIKLPNDIEKAKKLFIKSIENYDSHYIRIEITDTLDTGAISEIAKKNNKVLSIKEKKKKEPSGDISIIEIESNQFSITPDNITTLLLDRLGLEDDELSVFNNEFNQIIKSIE